MWSCVLQTTTLVPWTSSSARLIAAFPRGGCATEQMTAGTTRTNPTPPVQVNVFFFFFSSFFLHLSLTDVKPVQTYASASIFIYVFILTSSTAELPVTVLTLNGLYAVYVFNT